MLVGNTYREVGGEGLAIEFAGGREILRWRRGPEFLGLRLGFQVFRSAVGFHVSRAKTLVFLGGSLLIE